MQETRIAAILVLLMFILMTPQSFAYSGGDGTPSNPFQIATAADLMELAGNTDDYTKHFILTANIDLTGQGDNPDGSFSTAVIAPDTDNSSNSFVGTKFTGSLNGFGYKISGLTINTNAIENHYLGLFGYLDIYAEITHLQLDNIVIIGSNRSYYVGGICGYNYYITDIFNCSASGSITGGYRVGAISGYSNGAITQCASSCIVQGDQSTGGICGLNGSGGTMRQCVNTGNVTGDHYTVGVMCGQNFYGSIEDSYATGNLTTSYYTGGFCGENYGSIRRCYSTNISFCEKNWGAITDCYWDTELSGYEMSGGGRPATTSEMMSAVTFKGWKNGNWVIYEGSGAPTLTWEGKAGSVITTGYPVATYPGNGTTIPFELSAPAHLVSMSQRPADWDKNFILTADIDMSSVSDYVPVTDFTGTLDGQGHVISNLNINANVIKNLYEIALIGFIDTGGMVRNLSMTNVSLTGQELVGGVCGMNEGGTIDNCHVTGSVTNTILADIAGGLCGYNHSEVVDCHAEVDISGEEHIGGLCGWNAIGSINTSYATGNITGRWMVGGLCGTNAGTIQNCYARGNVTQSGYWPTDTGGICGHNGKVIENCYSTGSVNGSEGDIGGIVGTNIGSFAFIENCFWNIENQTGSTTEGVGSNTNGGTVTNVFAKTTAEMQTQTTYTDYGWEFGIPSNPSIWKMLLSGYPQLEWQSNRVDIEEFALLAQYWQMTGCDNTQPCAAADWYVDEVIDVNDLMQLAQSWLAAEMQIYQEQPPEIFDGFETGDFNTLNWQHSGGFVNWSIVTDEVYEGSYAANSGTITNSQTSTIQLTIDTTGFDTISFARKVSSELNYDFLYFYIDLVETASFSGEQDWQVVEYPISGGLHTFIWEYYKDSSLSNGQDCAWIDNIRFYNSTP